MVVVICAVSSAKSKQGTVRSQVANQAPSDGDSEASNSIDLVRHSPPLSQADVPVDDESGDCQKMPEGTIEEGGASEWETVSDFASNITRAAKNALSNRRPCFKKVVAVIAYWETATRLEHLRDQVNKLGRLFEDRFKSEVLVYKIPDTVTDRNFISTIGSELDKVSKDRDSLFILYYGGHASIVDSKSVRL